MCIVLWIMEQSPENGRRRSFADLKSVARLRPLLEQAVAGSWIRSDAVMDAIRTGSGELPAFRQKAALQLEGVLTGNLARLVDAGAHVARVATLHQMASDVLDQVMTSTSRILMPSRKVKALGFVVRYLMDYVASCAVRPGSLNLYLVLDETGDDAMLALAVHGEQHLVGNRSCTSSLLSAAAMLEAMGGEVHRGIDDQGRMVFGAKLPCPKP